MIINSFIGGLLSESNIILSTAEPFLTKFENDTIEITFNYQNLQGYDASAVLFINGILKESLVLDSNLEKTINITPYVPSTGLYEIRVIAIDKESSTDFVDFKVLYNYENLNDFVFEYNSTENYYTLTNYIGTDQNIVIPEMFNGLNGVAAVSQIGEGAFFDNDSIETVVIPSSIYAIGSTAFFSCTNLRSVTVEAAVPPTLGGDNVFDPYNELSLLKIYVPAASVNDYKAAQYWDEYANDIFAI